MDLGDYMELKTGMLCKHFKGENLIEKNIYQILAINVTYTGDNDIDLTNMVIYKPLFQEGKVFAREYEDLVEELTDEQKLKYHQTMRVEPLTEEEQYLITTDEFIEQKKAYIKEKYGNQKTV